MVSGPLPLDDIRVLDMTRARAGPTAVRHLADWGAKVIRIDDLSGADASTGIGSRDGSDFLNLHRNKRAITLNLKAPEGKDIFLSLAKQADVVIENFRPDVKHRLGLDYEALKAVNPRIIYGSISAFGQEGPYAGRPGVDQIAQGMGGIMSITGFPGGGPVRVGIPITDVTAGLTLAYGIMLALHNRARTGEGQWVCTSLVEAEIAILDFQAARWLVDHEVPEQAGNDHPTLMPTGVFETSDGFMNIAATNDRQFARLAAVFGDPDMLEVEEWKTSRLRGINRESLKERMNSHTRTNTKAYWVEKLNDGGVPCGPINTIDQALTDPQIEGLHMARPVEHPRLGHMELVGQAISMPYSFGRPEVRMHAPEYNQDTEAVLAELGKTAEDVAALREKGVIA